MSDHPVHALCDDCFAAVQPGRTPHRLVESFREVESCCRCGVQHASGIYWHDPAGLTHCPGPTPATMRFAGTVTYDEGTRRSFTFAVQRTQWGLVAFDFRTEAGEPFAWTPQATLDIDLDEVLRTMNEEDR